MTTRKPMWIANCSSIFSERAEVLGTVSQHVHHVVVKVRGLKRSSTGRGPNLESTVDMGFVGNVRGNIRAFGAAFEVLLLGVVGARGFVGHHTVRTSGGMFHMWSLAARARTVQSV